MAYVIFDCLHCGANEMRGQILSTSYPPESFVSKNRIAPFCVVNTTCTRCWNPINAKLVYPEHNSPIYYVNFCNHLNSIIKNDHDLVGTAGFRASLIRTPPKSGDIPAHVSDAVMRAYKSAEMNYRVPDNEDAAATMYRRAIDVAIREKHPEVKGNLAPRIARLVELGEIPPQMKEWADQIRSIGNTGAHDPEGVTPEELTVLRGFTEAFLRYFITLPFDVALRRGEIDEKGNPVAADPVEVV